MKRVRQEASEHYEVTAREVALALGLFVNDGDEVSLSCRYGDKFSLIVRSAEIEDVEIETPIPGAAEASYDAAYMAGLEASTILFGYTPAEAYEVPLLPLPPLEASYGTAIPFEPIPFPQDDEATG